MTSSALSARLILISAAFLNEEMNVVIEDEAFTKTVLETIELDIKKSDPLTKEHYKNVQFGRDRQNGSAKRYLTFCKGEIL